ncbi:hypothetical protein FRC17_011163 [Serendipita sp. 399]|nr:hypothetical protein FRC17_011163 [Serendipita sp. 399]
MLKWLDASVYGREQPLQVQFISVLHFGLLNFSPVFRIPFGTFFDVDFPIENTLTRTEDTQLVPDPSYRYPHDSYLLNPILAFYNNATNTSIPLIAFPIANAANSFVAETDPLFQYECSTTNASTPLQCGEALIFLTRTAITKSIAILALVISWLLTMMTVVLTIFAWSTPMPKIAGEQIEGGSQAHRDIPDSILIFPVATILAIPTFRSLFPFAPPTGTFSGLFFDYIWT